MPDLRIFTAALSTETNTFTPMPTTRADFSIYNPADSEGRTKPHPAYDILHRRAAAGEGIVVIEGLGASAPPSGNVRQDTYVRKSEKIQPS